MGRTDGRENAHPRMPAMAPMQGARSLRGDGTGRASRGVHAGESHEQTEGSPSDQPNVVREPEIFLSMIGDGFGDANNLGFGPEEAARAVFELLNEKIDTNEAQKARHILNDELKAFWPKAA